MTIHKCPCGHPACNQYTLDTQSGVWFHKDVATLYDAAPDLLAACEVLTLWDDGFADRDLKGCVAMVRAAIAKATGEAA